MWYYPLVMHGSVIDGIAYLAGRWPLDPDLPTVVFIHGAGGSSVLWRAQVESLSGGMNTVALDLPGHGGSGGQGMDSVAGYAAAVDGFISSLGLERPIPCGLSLGGAIVLQLLLEYHGKCTAGILVNTGARLRVLPLIFETIERDYKAFVAGAKSMSISPRTDPAKIEPLLESMATCHPEIALGDFRACDSFDVMDRLAEIDVPVLVLTASEDRMTPAKYGHYLAQHIPDSRLVQIEDAGHLSPMEKPEEVTQAILEFVLSV